MKKNLLYLLFLGALFPVLFTFDTAMSETPESYTEKPYHCITRTETGIINWTTGMVTVIGRASIRDKHQSSVESLPGAARADASRHIIQTLKQIHINPVQTVENHAQKNDRIMAGIEKTARDADILKQHYTSDLTLEIQVTTSILGGFLQLVLPEDIRQISKINPELKQKDLSEQNRIPYTGMIIDARGLGVKPVLNPKIISEQGHDVYSDVFISRDFAVKNGICRYVCGMEPALNDVRVGLFPLVLKALRKEGKANSAIVISMSDYEKLEKATERHAFLRECKVIIVKDQ